MPQDTRYEEWVSYAYELATHKYADHPEVDTLIQETMLAFLQKEHEGKPIEHPKGFISAVMRNKHNDYLRRRYRDRVMTCALHDDIPAEEPAEDLSEEYIAVRREISRLIRIYREVTVRHYVHGHAVDRIAADLGIPRGTVLSRLSSARQQIKGGLSSMKPYSELSFEPKSIRTGIQGSTGFGNEPFSLVHSPIEENILIVCYERPLSVKDIGDTLGIPCAYIEPIIDKLVNGELLGRTDGGLIYTRCFMQTYESSFGDLSAQEALASAKAASVFDVFWKHIEPLCAREEFIAMNDKQKVTLLLVLINDALYRTTNRVTVDCENDLTLPERPNGGRWLMIGSIFERDQMRNSRYDASGPFTWDHGAPLRCAVSDMQSRFGDTHWCYPCDINEILRLYVSFFDAETKPLYARTYEFIPQLIDMHILSRDENGEAVPDFPAMTVEEYDTYWAPAVSAVADELFTLLKDELLGLYKKWVRHVPKHVDCATSFVHWGAIGRYPLVQMFAIADANLLPYPVEIGKTPLIFVKYRKS